MCLRVRFRRARDWARWVTTLAALAVAGAAQGAPVISIAPLRGAPAPALARQLQRELCGAFDCKPWHRVSTAGAPDHAKARRQGVAGIVTGFIAVPRTGPVAW